MSDASANEPHVPEASPSEGALEVPARRRRDGAEDDDDGARKRLLLLVPLVMAAAAIIFFAFSGFDAIATAAVIRPTRKTPPVARRGFSCSKARCVSACRRLGFALRFASGYAKRLMLSLGASQTVEANPTGSLTAGTIFALISLPIHPPHSA